MLINQFHLIVCSVVEPRSHRGCVTAFESQAAKRKRPFGDGCDSPSFSRSDSRAVNMKYFIQSTHVLPAQLPECAPLSCTNDSNYIAQVFIILKASILKRHNSCDVTVTTMTTTTESESSLNWMSRCTCTVHIKRRHQLVDDDGLGHCKNMKT